MLIKVFEWLRYFFWICRSGTHDCTIINGTKNCILCRLKKCLQVRTSFIDLNLSSMYNNIFTVALCALIVCLCTIFSYKQSHSCVNCTRTQLMTCSTCILWGLYQICKYFLANLQIAKLHFANLHFTHPSFYLTFFVQTYNLPNTFCQTYIF